MSANMERDAVMSQHKRRHLVSARHLGPDPTLLDRFQALRKHLSKDPHPTMWRNRRRIAGETRRAPGEDVVVVMEIALNAAFLTGDERVIEATAQECDSFVEALRTRGMRRYIDRANGTATFVSTALAAHREMSEAMHTIAEALATGSPSDIDRARKEVCDVLRPAQTLVSIAPRQRPVARAGP